MSEEFYRTDLKDNAVDDLEKLCEFLELTKQNKSYWKWVIIALHGCLYKFMLCALKNPDCSGIWKNVANKKTGLIFRIDLFNKDNSLISFLKSFEWIKDKERMGSNPFVSNPDVDEAMKGLNTEIRNQFSHFKPTDWAIEINLMKEIVQKTLPIISFITSEFREKGMGRVRLLIKEDEQSEIDQLLKKIILKINSWEKLIKNQNYPTSN